MLQKALERFTKLFRSQVKLLTINLHATIYDATMSRIESTKSTFLRRRKSREFPTTCDFHFPAAPTRAQVESLSLDFPPPLPPHISTVPEILAFSVGVQLIFISRRKLPLSSRFSQRKICVHFSSISNWKLIDFVQSVADVRHFRIMLLEVQWFGRKIC